jgi:glucose-1-phosphate thymidylyltransferase
MRCLVLAGGFGTRLHLLAKDKPKPLLVVDGRPVITQIVEKVPRGMDIVVSTNRRFETYFAKWQSTLGRAVDLFVEDALTEEEKLGAIGSVNFLVRERNIQEDLLVIAGDNHFGFSLHDFLNAYDGMNPLVAVCDIGNKDKARQFGVVEMLGNRIVALWEKPGRPVSSMIATACYILPATVFEHLGHYCTQKRDNLGGFIGYLLDKSNVQAYLFDGPWLDVGSPDPYPEKAREVEVMSRK